LQGLQSYLHYCAGVKVLPIQASSTVRNGHPYVYLLTSAHRSRYRKSVYTTHYHPFQRNWLQDEQSPDSPQKLPNQYRSPESQNVRRNVLSASPYTRIPRGHTL